MSVYFHKTRKEWTYDFQHRKNRYTAGGFQTKREAQRAEAQRKEDVRLQRHVASPRSMAFEELVLRRMDHIKAYKSDWYYRKHRFMARRWLNEWRHFNCDEMTKSMVRAYLIDRQKRVSANAANKDLQHLRACFNWGKKELDLPVNPTQDIEFFPDEKRLPYVPPQEDIDKVFSLATQDQWDYLWLIRDTLARVMEINRLRWEDVDFEKRLVTLYTRKKKGGHLTPRKIGMTLMVYDILKRRFDAADSDTPWVFWRYGADLDPITDERVKGPYGYRRKLMRGLCRRAKVKEFGYHALRHFGASLLDSIEGIKEAQIQDLLGHDNRITTHRYLQRIGESKHQAIQAMEKATMKSRLIIKDGGV